MLHPVSALLKRKTRRYLVAAASSPHLGLQCFIVECSSTGFSAHHEATIPYSPALSDCLKNPVPDISSFAAADAALTAMLRDELPPIITRQSRNSAIDAVIVAEYPYYRLSGSESAPGNWLLACGDARVLRDRVTVALAGSFLRHDILKGGSGQLPLADGDCELAKKAGGISVFINIGQAVRITVADPDSGTILAETDAALGTRHTDRTARSATLPDGLDRDGGTAGSGTADVRAVDALLESWEYLSEDLRQGFDAASHPTLEQLPLPDKLATITAFSACTISVQYKRIYPADRPPPTAIWISGGGVHNHTFMEYLRSYFSPIPVREILELGVPENNRFAISLALTVDAWIKKVAAKKSDNSQSPADWY